MVLKSADKNAHLAIRQQLQDFHEKIRSMNAGNESKETFFSLVTSIYCLLSYKN